MVLWPTVPCCLGAYAGGYIGPQHHSAYALMRGVNRPTLRPGPVDELYQLKHQAKHLTNRIKLQLTSNKLNQVVYLIG